MILLANGKLITRDPEGIGYLPDGGVVTDGGKIVEVGATADLRAKRELASDWERIELDERLGGLAFAQSVLDEAWQAREEETP